MMIEMKPTSILPNPKVGFGWQVRYAEELARDAGISVQEYLMKLHKSVQGCK